MRFLWDCAVFFTFSLCVAASASSAVFAASSAAAFAACEHGNKHFGHAVLGDATAAADDLVRKLAAPSCFWADLPAPAKAEPACFACFFLPLTAA